jgi:hypothetical protein
VSLRQLIAKLSGRLWMQPARPGRSSRVAERAPGDQPPASERSVAGQSANDLQGGRPELIRDFGTLLVRDRALWEAALAQPKTTRVLIATNVMGFDHLNIIDTVLAIGLTLRGAEVHFMECDAVLPACLRIEFPLIPDPQKVINGEFRKVLCQACRAKGEEMIGLTNLRRWHYSEFLTPDDYQAIRNQCAALDREQLEAMRLDPNDRIVRHAFDGAVRYYLRDQLPNDEEATNVLRRYVEAGLLTRIAYRRLLAREKYDVSVLHHGIYVPQGTAADVLKGSGVRIVHWSVQYRLSTFLFNHGLPEALSAIVVQELFASMKWNARRERRIVNYLKQREVGAEDWIWRFNVNPEKDSAAISRQLRLDPARPVIGMLSSVSWDASIFYSAAPFKNMIEWVVRTFDYFVQRPDLQLLLRIHPSEVKSAMPARQLLSDVIQERYPNLPSNIFVIPARSEISSYSAMSICDAVLIYGTTMGLEMAAVGKQVVVAGGALVRDKGISLDAKDASHYFDILDRLPFGRPLGAAEVERARKFAYHYFFESSMRLPFIVPHPGGIYGIELDGLSSLGRGHFPGLDVTCEGILRGRPFLCHEDEDDVHKSDKASLVA